jgi:4-hydroxy-3-methylbut-2-enyl diphosphate reductase
MIDNAGELQPQWLAGARRVGLTAGASAPELLVDQVITRLRELGAVSVRTLGGVEEHIEFPLPKGLGDRAMAEAAAGAATTGLPGDATRS